MSTPKDIREWIFTYRSYTPFPFLALMLVYARPTLASLVSGFLLAVCGEAIRFWGVSIAGSETRTTGTVGGTYLITTGPFAHVRNPLYLGNMLLYAGVGLMSMALFPWLLAAAIVWFYIQYSLIVSREEEYLRGRFGAEYEGYCHAVGRFVPRWTPFRSANPPPKQMSVAEGLASEKRTLQAFGLITAALIILFVARLG